MSELKQFQRNLDNDYDEKKHFVEADNSDSDEDEEIMVPVMRTGGGKRKQVDLMLVERLVSQQKTIGKLRTEVDTSEVHLRYLKLDLNNAQVSLEETKKKYDDVASAKYRYMFEVFIWRVLILWYLMYRMMWLVGMM
jgi:hypothetical protein